MFQDILLIDKPKGITSFDVIRLLRKKLNVRKMGHAGTLDPFATGLLIVAIGDATKKLSQFLKLPKTYEAEIVLSLETDTGDSTGKIVREEDVNLSHEAVLSAVRSLQGVQKLPVPIFSAIKRGGEALYKKARRGEKVEVPIKDMEIRSISVLNCAYENGKTVVTVSLDVSSGTYIRSVAVELGKRLGVPAMTRNLRRISIGDFHVREAESL